MRLLCVARHAFLSGHLCQYFTQVGIESHPAVGLEDAIRLVEQVDPDAVVADYDLLTAASLATWEADANLSKLALIAVSLTRRPEEVVVHEDGVVAGFLYLPTLERADALRIVGAACRTSRVIAPHSLPWPGTKTPQYR